MTQNTDKLIQTLMKLDDSTFNMLEPTPCLEELISGLIEIIEGVSVFNDAKRIESVLCLSKLVFDSNLLSETLRSNVISVVQPRLNVIKLF